MPAISSALAARWRVALLIGVTTLVWMAYYGRWTVASWSLPTDYRGDSLEILARIQAAAEGDTVPLRPQVISRLGAPFGANWSAYPSSDLVLLWLLGQLARAIGVFPAANIALLAATLTAALAFYGCARWLRTRWEWAFAGALLFAFTFQTFHRGLAHLFVVYSWTVPLALLSCGIVAASRRIQVCSRLSLFCVATAAIVGIGNPYTLFLYLQLLGWALLAQWFERRRKENLAVGLVALSVAIAAFVLVESHLWLFSPDTGAMSPVLRNYGGTERYALKPIELLLPPANHRWEGLAFFGQRYVRWSDWRNGEAFAPYLGLVGIAGFGWLAWTSLKAALRRQRLPGVALPAGWVLAFASVGGITNMLAFFTTVVVFRATNRYSIFLSALVLLFVVTRLSRWWARKPFWVSLAAAGLVTGVGLMDELPRAMDVAKQERIAQRVESDLKLGRWLERELPGGAMVFQLPVLGFPEVAPPHQLGDYEYFRPYLGTTSVRFTYGSLKERCRGRWQRETAELPMPEMVRRLEQYGFSALYVNRRGFADRGEKVLAELTALGRTRRFDSELGEQVVVLLKPADSPAKPLASTLAFGRGWHEPRPSEPRWAFGPAAMSYFNPFDRPLKSRVRIVISASGPRRVRVQVNDGDVVKVDVAETRAEFVLPILLKPGVNRIDLEPVEPAVRMGDGRDQLRAFAVHETGVSVDLPALPAAGVERS